MPDPAPLSWSPVFPPMAAFGGAPVYSAGGEALLVSVQNAAAGVTVKVTGRTLALGESKPSPFERSVIPATDRSVSTLIIPLPDGWLLSAQAIVSAGTPATGQTFVKISLIHGTIAAAPELWTLCADYATAKQSVSYPGAGIIDPTDTAGAVRAIAGTTPGAGVDIAETVPTGARWELISFHGRLTASAAVANRFPRLTLDDGTATPFAEHFPQPTAQTASQVVPYTWSQGVPPLVGQVCYQAPLPVNLRLGAASRVKTITTGIQGADQWDQVQYLVREWIEGN